MKRFARISGAALLFLIAVLPVYSQQARKNSDGKTGTGVLVLAHGGKPQWNDEVRSIVEAVDRVMPAEVAFGMASKRTIQKAVDDLVARGVERIVAVPLFVSSHSSVITSTAYLLGLRDQAPPELAVFAKMDHSEGGGHDQHSMHSSFDPTSPVSSSVPITLVPALDAHPLVAEILFARATSISEAPADEVVVIVAHGPVSEEDNQKWLQDMKVLADKIRRESNFRRIEYLTVRDDAPEPIYSKAKGELRGIVERASKEEAKVLIVPLLLAYGGIEDGIVKRLEGLSYTMADQALLPDERLVRWVLMSAGKGDERTADGRLK